MDQLQIDNNTPISANKSKYDLFDFDRYVTTDNKESCRSWLNHGRTMVISSLINLTRVMKEFNYKGKTFLRLLF
jgi:hypothetical protein